MYDDQGKGGDSEWKTVQKNSDRRQETSDAENAAERRRAFAPLWKELSILALQKRRHPGANQHPN